MKSHDVLNEVEKLTASSRKIKIAVAYLKKSGFEVIKDSLCFFVRKKGRLKILVGLADYYITDPEALTELVEMRKRLLPGKDKNRLQIRYYESLNFHPKLFIFEGKDQTAVILGSSNLTGGGLSRNIEVNVMLAAKRAKYGPIKDITDYFDLIWKRKGVFGPIDLNEEILRKYAYNKRVYQGLRSSQAFKKKTVPSSKFPVFKTKGPQAAKAMFSLFVDGLATRGKKLEAFCTKCDRLVAVSKKWLDYWVCNKHRGKKIAECPSPEEKGEKGGLIKLLIDDAEVNVKSIEKLCLRKGCKKHVDLTNDFYWLVCPKCYGKLNPNSRCRIPRSDDGFHYRLSCKEIWKN